MNIKLSFIISFVLLYLPFMAEVQATIYKCVKNNSDVYYNDKPCPIADKESQIKSVKDPSGGYIPPAFVAEGDQVTSKGVSVGATLERSINEKEQDLNDNVVNDGTSNSTGDGDSETNNLLNNSKSFKEESSKKLSESNGDNDSDVVKGSSNFPKKNVIFHETYSETEK